MRIFRSVFLAVIFFILVLLAVIVSLLLRKPEGFERLPEPVQQQEQVSEYFTHYLAPNVYNNYQLDKPFEVIVPQDGINGIIAEEDMLGWGWPVEFNDIVSIDMPVAVFTDNTLALMGVVDVAGLDIVVTVAAMPVIDRKGLLHLDIKYVRAGLLDISRLARNVTGKVIESQLDEVQDNRWLRDIKGACIENTPFEPIFPAYDKYIRLVKLELTHQKLVLVFEPSPGKESIANDEL